MSAKKLVVLLGLSVLVAVAFYFSFYLYGLLLLLAAVYVFYRRNVNKYLGLSWYVIKLLFKNTTSANNANEGDERFKTFNLPDNRKLCYLELGNPAGFPVFYFHGVPSSAPEALMIREEEYIKQNLRIIAPNRPGIGGSQFVKNRQFSHWPNDVVCLADHLGIDKFSVLGFSGGGAYAAACAAKIPGRLLSVAIVAGAWQMGNRQASEGMYEKFRLFWKVAKHSPFLLKVIIKSLKPVMSTDVEKEMETLKNVLAKPDFEVVEKSNLLAVLNDTSKNAIINTKGAVWDVRMYVKKWDFEPAAIDFSLTLFHGALDRNIPLQLAETMAKQIKNATLVTYPDDAHLSTLCNHFAEIAATLKGETFIVEATELAPVQAIENNETKASSL